MPTNVESERYPFFKLFDLLRDSHHGLFGHCLSFVDSCSCYYSLYFAKIGLGTPSRDYHVQVDTGSDILWVNCAGCISCPRKSDLVRPSPTKAHDIKLLI